MRSLGAASLNAEHVERRPPPFADASPKEGDLSRYFATPTVGAAPAPRARSVPSPVSDLPRAWPAFPTDHEERRRIEARGDCEPVTHADLMRQARMLLRAQPPRATVSLPGRIAGMFRIGASRRARS